MQMKSIFKSFFSLSLLIGTALYAQEPIANDSLQSFPHAKTDPVKIKNDSIFRGFSLKFDVFNPIYNTLSTSGRTSDAEVALNVNLLNSYFPALELGFASCTHTALNSATYSGRGVFTRIGSDFNIMKDKSNSDYLFFVGLRAGMVWQDFDINNINVDGNYWGGGVLIQFADVSRFDAWGEVLAGVQVNVFRGFNMGWTLRYKYLLTKTTDGDPNAWYVPGFGPYSDSLWGFNYYIGYTF